MHAELAAGAGARAAQRRSAGAARAAAGSTAAAGAGASSATGSAGASSATGSAIERRAGHAGTATDVAGAAAGLATGTPDLIRRAAAGEVAAPAAASADRSRGAAISAAAPATAGAATGSARAARSTTAIVAGLGRRAARSDRQQHQDAHALPHHCAHRDSIMHATPARDAIFPAATTSAPRIRAGLSQLLRKLRRLASSAGFISPFGTLAAPRVKGRRLVLELLSGRAVAGSVQGVRERGRNEARLADVRRARRLRADRMRLGSIR